MTKNSVYDKAKYHYQAKNFPKNLSNKQGFVHTGIFIAWVIENGLFIPVDHQTKVGTDQVRSREVTGAQFYEKYLDGTFTDEELTEEGNAFTSFYFDFETGQYLSDYSSTLGRNAPSLYHIEDSWKNYEKIAAIISQRYLDWQKNTGRKKTYFWKFIDMLRKKS